jgi:hypothetical protein
MGVTLNPFVVFVLSIELIKLRIHHVASLLVKWQRVIGSLLLNGAERILTMHLQGANMKVTIKLLTRDKSGKQTTTVVEGEIINPTAHLERDMWDVERAINEHTSIRCHVEISGQDPAYEQYVKNFPLSDPRD